MLSLFGNGKMLSIKLLESNAQIQSKIHKAYVSALSKHFKGVAGRVLDNIRPIISQAIQSSPEAASISGGKLRADFGLTSSPMPAITASVISTLGIKVDPPKTNGKTINGGFLITMQPNDYGNLLSLPIANQIIEGGSLPWLKWLLTLGDTIIIANFGVEYGPYGRTGKARMTEKARPFKVDSAFSGSVDDNFITRAISRNKNQIINAIIKAVE
jgi:hypothetical protein